MGTLKQRANTEAEKRQVVEKLYGIWIHNPELRLGQLILNVYYGKDPYYEEDWDLITKMDEFYKP